MAFTDLSETRAQDWLSKNTARSNRTEELSDAYKLGERFEYYANIFRANGDDDLIPGFLDIFSDQSGIDFHDAELNGNFEEGSPTAAQIWGQA